MTNTRKTNGKGALKKERLTVPEVEDTVMIDNDTAKRGTKRVMIAPSMETVTRPYVTYCSLRLTVGTEEKGLMKSLRV